MNTSAVLRLLAASNDDVVLASWAAVFDEYKMSPECDVSPYDCWEVLQWFISSGALLPAEYNGIDAKRAFFAGGRPTNRDIQTVLDRLAYLRSNREINQEPPMPSAPRQFNAFSADTAIAKRDEALPASPRQGSTLDPSTSKPTSFAAFQASNTAPARQFDAIAKPPTAKLPCREPSTATLAGPDLDVQMYCCRQQISLIPDDEDIVDGEVIDGEEYEMHEYVFHGECRKCGAIFHSSMAKSIPRT